MTYNTTVHATVYTKSVIILRTDNASLTRETAEDMVFEQLAVAGDIKDITHDTDVFEYTGEGDKFIAIVHTKALIRMFYTFDEDDAFDEEDAEDQSSDLAFNSLAMMDVKDYHFEFGTYVSD